MGAAELVPGNRIELARRLRIGSWVAFLLYAALVARPPFLTASVELKVAAVAGVLFLVAFGSSMNEVFDG